MKFVRNVLSTFGTEVVAIGLNMVLGIVTARLLGPDGRGILTLVMTLPITLVHLADLGVSQANIYMIARQRRPAGLVASNSAVIALVSGSFIAAVLWLARGMVQDTLFRGLPVPYYGAILLLIPLFLLHNYWNAMLRALERFTLFNLVRLVMPVALLISITPALVISRGSIEWATAAYLVATLVAVGIGLLVVARHVHPQPSFEGALARGSLAYGLKSYVQNLMAHLTYRLDIYLVAAFLEPADVAYYSIAVSIAEVAWHIPNSVGAVLFPRLSNENEDRIHPLTAEVCRHTFAITALAMVAITAVGVVGIPLIYGVEYRPAIYPLLALGPGIVVMSLYKVLTRNFSSRDRQEISIVAALAALIVNVSLNVILIPALGVIGAAFASLIGYCTASAVLLVGFCRESHLPLHQVLILQPGDLRRLAALARPARSRVASERVPAFPTKHPSHQRKEL
jgi:O-antigen/teichoic acid export membrane protein